MKRFIIVALALICAGFLFSSCDKDNSSGGGDTPVIVDPAIIGTWLVTSYEGLDKEFKRVKYTDDQSDIIATYWRFDFNSDSAMSIWFKDLTSPLAYVDFFYSSGYLYFGDTGYAEVEKLTDDTMVFVCDSFMPIGWETDLSIKTVRTTCRKKTE